VTAYDEDLRRLVDDMFASMYAAQGVGLAANQIGIGLAVFVYDCPDDEGTRQAGVVVNPHVEACDGADVLGQEGCLSVPGLAFDTSRRAHTVVSGFDIGGEALTVEGQGFLARCLQHETDHLAGAVYLDRLTGDERKAALRAVRSAGLI
jgi:peptide deformylase